MEAGLPAELQETQLNVRNDAFHIGHRCIKKGPTKGCCDLCYILLGRKVPETTLHIVRDCPFTRPVLTTIWRSIFIHHAQPHLRNITTSMDETAFCTAFTRRIVLGVAAFDDPQFAAQKSLQVPIATLSAIVNTVLVRRRNHNALNTKCPLQHDTQRTVRDICHLLRDITTTSYKDAVAKENHIYTHYEGWLPDEDKLPTSQWLDAWTASNLLDAPTGSKPTTALKFSLPVTTPGATAHPTYNTHDPSVAARIGGRIRQISY